MTLAQFQDSVNPPLYMVAVIFGCDLHPATEYTVGVVFHGNDAFLSSFVSLLYSLSVDHWALYDNLGSK